MVIEQWVFFSVSYLLWHGYPFIMVISEDLWHSHLLLGFEQPTFLMRGERSNQLHHRRGLCFQTPQTTSKKLERGNMFFFIN